MKKRELIKNFLIGGCVGKTLMEVSGIIANFFMKNNLTEAISKIKSLMVIFVIGGIAYIFANLSITKIEKKDMKSKDISPIYLVTDHTGFYERYGWEFLCMVKGNDPEPTRMYVHY